MLTKNIAYDCVTEKCALGLGAQVALRWLNSDLSVVDYTYQDFEDSSNQLAHVLAGFDIQAGDVMSIFLPRSEHLISAFFAIQKLQAMSCILFSTLGEEAMLDRLENSAARIVITKKSLLRKVLAIKEGLPQLKAILVTDLDAHQGEQVFSLPLLLEGAGTTFDFAHYVDPETPAFLQYTSGSTGKPKGALHVHSGLAEMQKSMHEIMPLEKGDLYWCTADPAWITGLVYGIILPFSLSIRQVQFSGGYNAEKWMQILDEQGVNLWYTAPTALRMLMQEEELTFSVHQFAALKHIYSVGEPLNPEIFHWGKKIFKKEIYDTWFQTETGCIMIANKPGMTVKPGSMGMPRAGIEIRICDDEVQPVPVGKQGYLTLKAGWGSMFRTYYQKDKEYQEKFRKGYYFTGDLAKQDEDGYVWYISRSDDVINTAGHLVGPFEVESALLEIEEVNDVAVIGVPDPLLHQKIIAFLVLRPGESWGKALELKCRIHVSNRVSSFAMPSDFVITDKIPKNQSGKILRRVLKAQYDGTDAGDLSTME